MPVTIKLGAVVNLSHTREYSENCRGVIQSLVVFGDACGLLPALMRLLVRLSVQHMANLFDVNMVLDELGIIPVTPYNNAQI